jgi:hypothetical protein
MIRSRLVVGVILFCLPALAGAQTPPPCGPGGAFPDVPQGHPFCAWIQQLAADQIATKCDASNFCPDAPVTRAQLSLLLYKLTRGTPTSVVDADTLDGIDSSGFGDITGVGTSGGLSGGATSGAVALSIADSGVTTGKIENGTILFEDLAANGCASNAVIKRSGSVWTCATVASPVAFVHTVLDNDGSGFPNHAVDSTWLNQAQLNGNANAIVVATARASADTKAVAVRFADLGGSIGVRWMLYHPDGSDFTAGQTFNIVAVP